MQEIEMQELTKDTLEEAIEVFRLGGWDETSLLYVKAEMTAFLNGDIPGYIRAKFITAAVDGRIIGVAAWAPSMCAFAVYELSWATVLPEWRRRGVNTQMLQERLQRIRQFHGSEPFVVIVYTWDNPMYAKKGFSCFKPPIRQEEPYTGKCLLVAHF